MTAFPDLLSAAQLLEGVRDAFEERAAIREHDGQQPAADAELAAWADAIGVACQRRKAAEDRAVTAALHAAEAWCDEAGVYDFREMSEAQAVEFVRRLIGAHRAALVAA